MIDISTSCWSLLEEASYSHICDQSALLMCLKHSESSRFKFRFYAAQVVCMFEYLHSKNIIYRLRPPYVLEISSLRTSSLMSVDTSNSLTSALLRSVKEEPIRFVARLNTLPQKCC